MKKLKKKTKMDMSCAAKGVILSAVFLVATMFAAGPAYSVDFLLYGDNQISSTTTVKILKVKWKDEGSWWVDVDIDDDTITDYETIATVYNLFLGKNDDNRWQVQWKCSGGSTHTTEEVMDDNKSTLQFKNCDGTVKWLD